MNNAQRILATTLTLLLTVGAVAAQEESWYTQDEIDSAVAEAIAGYRQGQKAAVVAKSTRAVWPFDESQPELVCSPDYVCVVELEPGERVAEDAGGLGDTLRWSVHNVTSLSEPPVVHVLFKPVEFGLRTNAVLVTDRRTYHLTLKSPTATEIRSGAPYVRHASFYYPRDFVLRLEADKRAAASQVAQAVPQGAMAAVSPSELNFAYDIRGGKRVAFAPQTVFDDGERTFLRFTSRLKASDLPTVLAAADGKTEAVNFHWNEHQTLVVDGLYPRLQLVVGTGKGRKAVDIYRQGS